MLLVFFVILLFDILGSLCFHPKHYGALKNEQMWACSFWQKCFIFIEVSKMGALKKASSVEKCIYCFSKYQQKGCLSKLCGYGCIILRFFFASFHSVLGRKRKKLCLGLLFASLFRKQFKTRYIYNETFTSCGSCLEFQRNRSVNLCISLITLSVSSLT